MFVLLYIFGVLRSIFAYKLGNAIMKKLGIRYKTPSPYLKSMNKFQKSWTWIKRQFVYFYNLFVWIPRQGSTKKELVVLFNRTLNSFSAYISFIYIFMMTTASEIFVCTYQPNGMYTLNESPNIFWFVNFLIHCQLSRWLVGFGSYFSDFICCIWIGCLHLLFHYDYSKKKKSK
jgi:hypothetical protein